VTLMVNGDEQTLADVLVAQALRDQDEHLSSRGERRLRLRGQRSAARTAAHEEAGGADPR
jgi:hypothetical protein